MSCRSDFILNPPEQLIDALRSRDNFLLATHVNPDGDAIGSAVALAMALEGLGKKVVLVDKHPVPSQYFFMPGHGKFHTYESFQEAGFSSADFETLLLIDCNNAERIGLENKEQHPAIEELKKAISGGIFTVVIDHHHATGGFGHVKWIDPSVAATGMMVYSIIKSMGVAVNMDIATNIYTAMVIDTGNFRFDNTGADVFRVAAELADLGIVPSGIYEEVYQSFSASRFSLYMKVIGSIEVTGDVAVSTVTKKMIEETSASADDTEDFVSFPKLMKHIKIAVLVRELNPGECKLSLRSKGDINVAGVAEYFHGGGHKNAAGCRIKAGVEEAKRLVLEKIREMIIR
jgi:bifunctional oligoribonuclease and PAP phosphatase NrnA